MAAAMALVGACALVTSPALAGATVPTPRFTQVWDTTVPHGFQLSDPVTAKFGGRAAVVTGDTGGDLDAYWLDNGHKVPGWPVQTRAALYKCPSGAPCPYVALGIEAPISADLVSPGNDDIFAQIGGGAPADGGIAPDFDAFTPSGHQLYGTDPSVETTDSQVALNGNGSGPGLSGVTLDDIGGQLDGFSGASTGHVLYGINALSGAQSFGYVNGDTVIGTPAAGSIGSTEPNLVYANGDSTYSAAYPGSFSGTYLRVLEPNGQELCSAHVQSPDPTDNYQGGSGVTSPVIADFGSTPLVVIGQGDRSQYSTHLMAFSTACQEIWESPSLAGPTNFSPVAADVTGNGVPSVIEETENAKDQPVIYEINGNNGSITRQKTLTACTGVSRFTTSQSVVTADLSGDAYQDIIAPAGTCGYAVLDGRTLDLLKTGAKSAYLSPRCAGDALAPSANTALLTPTTSRDGTVLITIAGTGAKPGAKGCVVSWAVHGAGTQKAELGISGWPEFHRNQRLAGFEETSLNHFSGRDVLGPGEQLSAGQELTSENRQYTAVMQKDGNFVVYRGTDALWSTATYYNPQKRNEKGRRIAMQTDGNLVIYDRRNQAIWSSNTAGATRPTELVMQNDGNLVIYEGPTSENISSVAAPTWASGS